MADGIRKRDGRPSPWEASVFDPKTGRKLRKCFRDRTTRPSAGAATRPR